MKKPPPTPGSPPDGPYRLSEPTLHATLQSIGDGVVATDLSGRVTLLNPVAEALTGWTQAEALGKPIGEVFRIVNERTRRRVDNPAERAIEHGVVVGLANHTVLVARDGTERAIDDSGAPIRAPNGDVTGAVLVFRDITDRRKTDYAMQRLAAVVEGSGDAILSKDLDGIITSWNPAAERTYGYAAEEVIGHSKSILIPPDLSDELPNILRRIRAGEHIEPYQTVRVRKDGVRIDVAVTVSPMHDSDGNVIGASTIARDITQRRQAERVAAAQYELGLLLAEATDVDQAAWRFLEAIGTCLEWEVGAFWLVDRAQDVLRAHSIWHRPGTSAPQFEAITLRTAFHAGIGLPGRVWASGKPAWVGDVTKDTNFPRAPYAAREGLRAGFAFPIQAHGETVGVVEFFSRAIREPDEELVRDVATFGHQIGQFMERRRVEDALRESEEQTREIIRSALDCIIVIDREGHVREWNPAAESTFGYSYDRAVGRELAELIIPEELRGQHRGGLKRYLETGEGPVIGQRLEMTAVRADGSRIPVELAVTGGRSGADPTFTGFVRDITARRKAERNQQVLVEAGATLAASLDPDSILNSLAQLLVPRLADWCVIDMRDDDGHLQRIATTHSDPEKIRWVRELDRRYPPRRDVPTGPSRVVETLQPELLVEIPDELIRASAFDDEHYRIIQELGLKSYLCVPLVIRGQGIGALSLVQAESRRSYGPDDVELAEELARRAAIAIDQARLYEASQSEAEYRRREAALAQVEAEYRRRDAEFARIEAEYHRREASLARDIQLTTLTPPPRVRGFEIAVRYEPMQEVGGDLYSFFTAPDRLGVVVGDVSGKGIPAALTATSICHLVNCLSPLETPDVVLEALNRELVERLPEAAFATLALLVFQRDGEGVTIYNAGHPPPLWISGGEVTMLEHVALPLGVMADAEFGPLGLRFVAGETLVLYSDAFFEVRNAAGKELSLEGLADAVRRAKHLGPEAMADRLLADAHSYGEVKDDLTLVVIRRENGNAEGAGPDAGSGRGGNPVPAGGRSRPGAARRK